MKLLSMSAAAVLLAVAALPALAMPGATSPARAPLQGEVLEVVDVPSYTYLRLKTATGETWAAVATAKVAKGAKVAIGSPTTMRDFDSSVLKRRFDTIVFGQLVTPVAAASAGGTAPSKSPSSMFGGAGAAGPGAKGGMGAMGAMGGNPHGSLAPPAPATAKVAKASGADARTVAEIVGGRAALKDKPVVVQARVVKFNSGIMGKNWIHLQDGSGSPQDGSHDVLVTTKDRAAVGDVVTVRGTVRTDVTIGPGYAYAVLVEDATVKK